MRQAYLDYSMSVIVARALPDVRDGLKPVQRRILYTMYESGLRNDRPFRKSATTVGDVMGKYHPHGDAPIYDALVRLAQDFAARYPLVQGQGNFGCFTGDTKVELYNGEQKPFTELVEMAHKGLRAEIFTVDPHRNVRIKPLRAPRLVRRNDPVVKVRLETGAEIVCTPDHRFMLRDGTYREAQQLKAKDQLMPFSRSAIPERLHRTGAFPIPASLSQKVSTVEPAGRADVYDLTVDLTQNFALAAGVFVHNSIDDDPPAHMRYTEARLAAISTEMLADIEKETVDWTPNYDNRHLQPTVLPARVPNLIVNGSAGIAVGMATNIPPHNLREIVAATKRLIDDPELTTDDLCETVIGPDFPGGGVIYRFDEQRNVETGAAERVDAIRRAYAQGRGRIVARAKAHNEQPRGNRDAIIVTELPYAVNKASLIEKIADLVQNKKLPGISDIRDESDREGMRIVIEVKRDDDATLVLNNLYKHTAMQSAFNFNMLALVDQQPRTLSLKEILQHHVDHRREVIRRRTDHDLRKAKERAHILEGLKIAHDHIDEIIKLIRAHKGQETLLVGKLREGFGLSEAQAKAILEMQLRRLSGLERQKLDDDEHLVVARSHDRLCVFTDRGRVFALKVFELPDASRSAKGTPIQNILEAMQAGERVTALVALRDTTTTEHLVMATRKGFIKKTPLSEYANVRRAGLIAIALRKGDELAWVAPCTSQDRILLATRKGKAITFKATDARPMGRQTQGVTGIRLQKGDEVVGMGIARPRTEALSVTENGFGKRTAVAEFPTQGRGGQGVILAALSPKTGNVAAIQMVDEGTQEILLITSNGVVIRTPLEQVRALGRATMGVKVMAVGETKIASIATFTPMRPAQTQLDLPR